MTTPHAQTVSTDKLVTILREAWYAGRPIVPLVGAGMSVDSGMPALSSIIRYVAKLQVYLDKRMYLPDPHSRVLLNKIDEKLNSQPWEFITAFGWPDRFQLNFDVRQALNQTDLNTAIGEALTALAAQIHPGSTWHLNDYIGRVAEKFEKLNETYAFEGGFLPKAPSTTKYVDSFAFQVSADWKPLLREVTGHNQALIDALFGRLARHRHPGLGHKFLAHLCQLLRVRTLLTFNFDSLIEAAFISEKLSHRVFSMEHGTQLPSVSLLDDSLSVIKMHGSTHNILVDERVDYRITNEYDAAFERLIGDRPLLLVMGCSGNDRRLRDLVKNRLAKDSECSVVWIFRAENNDVGRFLPDLKEDATRVYLYPSYDVGQTLRQVFTSITGRLPAGTTHYVAHITTPILRESSHNLETSTELIHTSLSLFFPDMAKAGKSIDFTCRRLMESLAKIPLSYTRLFVDLEEHHSLDQVVAEIISQVRRGDTSIAPYVSPISIDNSVQRVLRALRRSRYVLIIANIDAIAWRATTHHGLTSVYSEKEEVRLQKHLDYFLVKLSTELVNDWERGDSTIVLHSEYPYARHYGDPDEVKSAKKVATWIKKLLKQLQGLPRRSFRAFRPRSAPPWGDTLKLLNAGVADPGDRKLLIPASAICMNEGIDEEGRFALRMLWTIIACHRRTRLMTGMKQLLGDLGLQSDIVNVSTRSDLADNPVSPLGLTEGGGWWCDRPWRDAAYDYSTALTDKRTRDVMRNKQGFRSKAYAPCVGQHLVMTALHDVIARNYYINVYLPSRDSFAFLEYVYHRISTLRYLTALVSLLGWNRKPDDLPVPTDVVDVCSALRGKIGHDWDKVFDTISPPNTKTEGSTFPTAIQVQAIRLRCLRGFTETWRRTESVLRRNVPSEQLISWCRTLLYYDLAIKPEGSNKSMPGRLSLKYYKLEGDAETEEVKNELKRAEYGIVNTLNKCYYEAGNFRKMKDVRARTPQGFPRLPTGKKPKKELSEACHDSIDVLLADHWMNYSSTSNSSELQRVGNKIQAQIAKSGIERRGTLYPEAHLRATYLEHEIELGFHSSVGCRPLRDAVSSSVPLREEDLRNHQIKLRKHREIIVGAIDFAREEYRINKEWEPRSPILEQSFDHGLFIPYRSLFMILSGRYRTIEGVDRVNLLRATMAKDGQSVDRQNWDVDFREALRDFSSAHGGVGEENSILKAIADIAAAETCMQMSRSLYLMQSAQDDTTGRKVCDAVDAKLRSASGYLWRAAESLASAPQYVFVWKFHYVAQASYHIERTLWNMLGAFVSYKSTATIRGTESRRQMMEAGNLLDRARRGLAAIRSGLDHTAQDEDRFKAEWRYQWGRLACTSVAAAMLRKLISEARPFDTVHDSVSTSKLGGNLQVVAKILSGFWGQLNVSQGIRMFCGKDAIDCGKDSDDLDEFFSPLWNSDESDIGAEKPESLVTILRGLERGNISDWNSIRSWLMNDACYKLLRLDADEREQFNIS